MYFPLIATSDESSPAPEALDTPHGRGESVLVVEDEPALRRVVARILTEGGCVVLAAGSVPEALDIARDQPFDLLLTHVDMPEMSGHGLVAKLASTRAGMRVLFMFGYSDGLLGSARALDTTVHVIEKPFTADHLLRRVATELAEVAVVGDEWPAIES